MLLHLLASRVATREAQIDWKLVVLRFGCRDVLVRLMRLRSAMTVSAKSKLFVSRVGKALAAWSIHPTAPLTIKVPHDQMVPLVRQAPANGRLEDMVGLSRVLRGNYRKDHLESGDDL